MSRRRFPLQTAAPGPFTGNGGLRAGVRAASGVEGLSLDGDKVSDIKVGKFSATKVEAQNGAKSTCGVYISVIDKSSVSVISTLKVTSEDSAAARERAPKLPQ